MKQPNWFSRLRERTVDFLKDKVAVSDRESADPRRLSFEPLEERQVLDAGGMDIGLVSFGDLTADAQNECIHGDEEPGQNERLQEERRLFDITSVTLLINGEELIIGQDTKVLELDAGDRIEIVGVDYAFSPLTGDGLRSMVEPDPGMSIMALESYINKLAPGESGPSATDYSDGRYSLRETNPYLNSGMNAHRGVEGGWNVEEGWDRLSLNLMRYQPDSTSLAATFVVNLQVGTPDFAFDADMFDAIRALDIRQGETVHLAGAWMNLGLGHYHGYAEVDIYHVEDQCEHFEWAGVLVGNTDSNGIVRGEFVNPEHDADLDTYWAPQEQGEYVLRFYTDPERNWNESNESNNFVELRINVDSPNRDPVAVDDVVRSRPRDSFHKLHHSVTIDALSNDHDPDGDQLRVHEYSQAEHGSVTLNQDGTFTYRSNGGHFKKDQFAYTITDGNGISEKATVTIVNSRFKGQSGHRMHLHAGGQAFDAGNFHFNGEELNETKLAAAPITGQDQVSPADYSFDGHADLFAAANRSIGDGMDLVAQDVRMHSGASAILPIQFDFGQNNQAHGHELRFEGLPETVTLSSGYREGSSWVIDQTDVDEISIFADDQLDQFKQTFDIKVSARALQLDGQTLSEKLDEFKLFLFRRR